MYYIQATSDATNNSHGITQAQIGQLEQTLALHVPRAHIDAVSVEHVNNNDGPGVNRPARTPRTADSVLTNPINSEAKRVAAEIRAEESERARTWKH
jgi:hypothetical protein